MDKSRQLDDMARALRQAGYKVSRKATYQRRTFAVEKALLSDFTQAYELLGYNVQDAINEAIAQWVGGKRDVVAMKRQAAEAKPAKASK
jgi:hypothetical protein